MSDSILAEKYWAEKKLPDSEKVWIRKTLYVLTLQCVTQETTHYHKDS